MQNFKCIRNSQYFDILCCLKMLLNGNNQYAFKLNNYTKHKTDVILIFLALSQNILLRKIWTV